MITFKQFISEEYHDTLFDDIYTRIKTVNGEKYIDGDIKIASLGIHNLPDLSDVTVNGGFYCGWNYLTNLKGSPKYVTKMFSCPSCLLTTLEGAPERVEGSFLCMDNALTSLKYSPKYVGDVFNCKNNHITSLVGAPEHVEWYFNCKNNHITSLVGAPEYIGGEFRSNKFSQEDYLQYISMKKHMKTADPETQDLFGGMIDTI